MASLADRASPPLLQTTIVFIEYVYDINIPDEAFYHPTVKAVSELSNDIISWANDIYSFNNEYSRAVSDPTG